MKERYHGGRELKPETLSDRVRRLCKASLDSDLAESATILAAAYDEMRASAGRMLEKMEVVKW
jgi:hypothetical protein